MCDRGCYSLYSAGSNNFYYEYLQQHAQMMQWIQNLHSDFPYSNESNAGYCRCCNEQTKSLPRYPSDVGYCRCCHEKNKSLPPYAHDSAQYYPHDYVQEEYEDFVKDEVYGIDDDSSSGDELVFNVDAILAMRAERAMNSNSEEESFELIDSVTDEEFEFVELNPFGGLDKKHGVKHKPDTNADTLHEKEVKKFLYGDKADMIAGLETSIAINFERLCDIHQPHLWPVLPLRL